WKTRPPKLPNIAIPALERLQKEGGEEGKEKINKITRYSTVVLAAIQAIGLISALNGQVDQVTGLRVLDTGYNSFFGLLTIGVVMAGGTALAMWIGERITKNGIGNGISLLIFAGIISNLFSGLLTAFTDVLGLTPYGTTVSGFLILMITALVIITVVTFIDLGERRIPVQYAKRVVGRKMYGGASSFLPIKIDQSGVIAVIFAIALLTMPLTVAQFNPNAPWAQSIANFISRGHWLYEVLYAFLIVFFCYFYNSVSFNPKELSENMKKWGGFVPGIRPGEPTAEYIEWILNRITLGGALFVVCIAILPDIMRQQFNVPFYFGGTSLLIVVGVALDTIGQLEAHLIMR
ncbi:MAG TPA: preprotein translocase subunit SecY, partial [Elusimicrobiales bacterium]|nr:preprotein translocase subunit SecY [Elusimicrobiales bacterium]